MASLLSARRTALFFFFVLAAFVASGAAQSSSNSSSSTQSGSQTSTSLSLTTSSFTTTYATRSGDGSATITSLIQTTFNATVTPSATSSASASASASSQPTLATKIDPAFGVLGAILILTGLPTAFLGHRNRWTSFFLVGFYSLALVCFVLIVRFGVLPAVNPPNKTIRGMFLLASIVAGAAGGGITIFFWKATKYLIGAWGGFAIGLWIQCFRDGGLIGPVGYRWIMYLACGVVGFCLCTIPKIHWQTIMVATAVVGATSTILGIDCFTTGNLKEFYMWNLGFKTLFPKFNNNGIPFPVAQIMQIELGLIAAVSLMGAAVQLRMINVLHRKLKEIQEEQRRRDEADEARAATRFASVDKERAEWEREHDGSTLGKHGRNDSNYSNMPLMRDLDAPPTPSTMDLGSTPNLFGGPRPRYTSGVSDFMAAPPPEEEFRKGKQSPMLNLDFGSGIVDDVPKEFIAGDSARRTTKMQASGSDPQLAEELKKKEALLAEIQGIRKSIEVLKTESSSSADSAHGSRHPSFGTANLANTIAPEAVHLRPPREQDPRGRIQSMGFDSMFSSSQAQIGGSLGRPSSVPLRDDNWDAYVKDRKLLQPPSGVTPPIQTTATPRVPLSPAVQEALARRHQIESSYELGEMPRRAPSSNGSSGRGTPGPLAKDYFAENAPLASTLPSNAHHKKASSSNQHGQPTPVTILPPRKNSAPIAAPVPQKPSVPRVIPFEELEERHREKLRNLQAPLTQATKEQADIDTAKAKWERAKAREREQMAKRQAEKAREYTEKQSKRKPEGSNSSDERPEHRRTRSGDALNAAGGNKRASVMRVEDWQRQQQGADSAPAPDRKSRRMSAAVPFPGGAPADRRRSSSAHMLNTPRDPPS